MNETPPDEPVTVRRIPWPTLFGIVIGLIVALIAVRLKFRDPSPPLTGVELTAARKLWREANIRDYDVETEVTSRSQEIYRVEIRDGQPQNAFRNGHPLQQLRTFDTWTVPGMFDTIASDVENLERVERGEATPETPRLMLRCTFDEKTGVPLRYRRVQWGKDFEMVWRVTKFEVVPAP